jgi:hypothetical protein
MLATAREVDFRMVEDGQLGAFEQRPLAFLGAVVKQRRIFWYFIPSCPR